MRVYKVSSLISYPAFALFGKSKIYSHEKNPKIKRPKIVLRRARIKSVSKNLGTCILLTYESQAVAIVSFSRNK